MSEFFRGRRMDRAGLRQASANYAVLPDEQYERLENIGHLATLAWREGYAAFGERPQRRPGLDNSQADRAGEVVADLVHSRAFDVLAVRDFGAIAGQKRRSRRRRSPTIQINSQVVDRTIQKTVLKGVIGLEEGFEVAGG